ALMAYLAVERRAFSREYLAALLWPDLGQKSALANLRRTLSLLRVTFANGCIVTEGDQVQIDRTLVNIDIEEFQALLPAQSTHPDLVELEAAAKLYRSSFLEGFSLGNCLEFDQWQDAVRERFRSELDSVLEILSRRYLEMGRPKLALPYAQRWLELDQWNEAAHRALMEIYKRTGRPDLARHQYELCVRALERDGLEPDDLTRDLNDAIAENHHTPQAGVERDPPAGEDRSAENGAGAGARRKRWLMYAGIAALVVVIIGTVGGVGGFFSRSDFMVTSAQVLQTGDELSAVRIVFRNEGVGRGRAGYSVVFSPDPVVGAAADFRVYSGEVRIDSNRDAIVVVDGATDIQEFVDQNAVRIPPGTYKLTVVVDPRTKLREDAEHNNFLASRDRFFFAGAADAEVLKVEITYNGEDSLDNANPIKVFIGDRTRYDRPEDWGRFRVSDDGQYYFPLDGVPRRDDDESGYFML
ncbi:MAG: hypothetical protein KAU31_13690, partial [Spirochaetaceae bacterium]|nr:hypothetical protein [Spirochaetaceae bacterium]